MSTTPSFEHEERVRQALQTFDLTLTRDDDVRYLAHGAVKSLELAAAFRDHSCVDALIAEGGEMVEIAEQVSLGVQSGGFTMYLDPGRYLVFPIPVESAEAKETPDGRDTGDLP